MTAMYAIQVRWPDGHWTYVMDRYGEQPIAHPTREAAERAAAVWIKPGHEDAVRVVRREEE